jgi:hypothetical protein
MAKATQAYQDNPARAMVLARWLAKKAAAEQYRAQGLKTWLIEPAVISRAADVYLNNHPEMVEKAQVWLSHISQHLHGKRRLDPKGQSLCVTHAQKWRPKR